jgi:hypothetical protein
VQHNQPLEAAAVLAKLADKADPSIPLQDRVENLNRAKNFLSQSPSAQSEVVQELQEKLDVAIIQIKILKQVEDLLKTAVDADRALLETAARELNGQLLNISDVSDASLTLFSCSHFFGCTTVVQQIRKEVPIV